MARRSPSFEDPTTRLIETRVAALYEHLPKAVAGEAEALHRMRVEARRLRVALPLLSPKPAGKRVERVRRQLRSLTRQGGGSRDLDVISALMDESVQATPGAELKAIASSLRRARARSRRRLAGELLDLDLARLRSDLANLRKRGGDSVFTAMSRLREASADERLGIVTALDALGDRFDPSALHRLRIRYRRLRYVAEVADALRGRDSGAPTLFREVQQCAGRLNDAWVLAGWLRRYADRAAARGSLDLAQAASKESDRNLETAHRLHEELLAKDLRTLLGRGLEAILAPRAA